MEVGCLIWEDGLGGEEEEDFIMWEFFGYVKFVQDIQYFFIIFCDMNVLQSVVYVECFICEVCYDLVL